MKAAIFVALLAIGRPLDVFEFSNGQRVSDIAVVFRKIDTDNPVILLLQSAS